MSQKELLSSLEANSLRVFAESRMVHMDDLANPAVEQTYLTFDGSPEAFRWLASLLTQMANSAEKTDVGNSVIVNPNDLQQRPITMSEWSSLDLICRRRTDRLEHCISLLCQAVRESF